jgi:hypothetical protein
MRVTKLLIVDMFEDMRRLRKVSAFLHVVLNGLNVGCGLVYEVNLFSNA